MKHVQKKTYVKLVTQIKNAFSSVKKPYLGQRTGGVSSHFLAKSTKNELENFNWPLGKGRNFCLCLVLCADRKYKE